MGWVNPTCKNCGHYNAMLEASDGSQRCRDCGHTEDKPWEPWRDPTPEPDWLEIEEQKAKQRRVDAEERLRDILREAFYLANFADTRVTAYQDAGETPIDEATGCYALIGQALSLMGDDVEYYCETGEFRTIKGDR